MSLLNRLLFILPIFCFTTALADSIELSKYFKGIDGSCFILYDITTDQVIHKYDTNHCNKALPPAVNFNLVLSLIGYDSKLINDTSIFSWNGNHYSNKTWEQDQDAASWIKNNVSWVSENLASKLGKEKMAAYLAKFRYGNQDLSSGLTNFWQSNASLKISPYEQLAFIKAFIKRELPVSKQAIEMTRKLFIQEVNNGWTLIGKAGAGEITVNDGLIHKYGWFVGEASKQGHKYAVVTNIQASDVYFNQGCSGCKARELTKAILAELNF